MASERNGAWCRRLVHGFNAHSGQYVWVAEHFVASGLAVYALDLRGRGKADASVFYVEKFADYVTDVDIKGWINARLSAV